MSGEPIPDGQAADDAWRELPWRDRTAMMFGRRSPQSEDEARRALGYARLQQERSLLLASLNGVAAVGVWWALSMIMGSPFEGTGPFVAALVFGVIVFFAQLGLERLQSRRLEERAREVLDGGPAAAS